MGFSYNVGKSLGATAITGVGLLSGQVGLAQAIGIFCLGAYAISVIALLLLPETKGISIEELDALDPALSNSDVTHSKTPKTA
jgi:hypothetical protein